MPLEQKFFDKEKPKNEQIIIIREKGAHYPMVGEYRILPDGKEKIYLPDHYQMIELSEVQSWWIGISDEFLKRD